MSNLHGYALPKFLPTSGFKWIVPKEFDLRISLLAIIQKDVFLKLILNIQTSYENYTKSKEKSCLNAN